MATQCPERLRHRLSQQCCEEQVDAFRRLVEAVVFACPGIDIRQTKRYWAFYRGRRLVASIDLQGQGIKFGFTEDSIRLVKKYVQVADEPHPPWRGKKTLGYSLQKYAGGWLRQAGDIAYLIIVCFRQLRQ